MDRRGREWKTQRGREESDESKPTETRLVNQSRLAQQGANGTLDNAKTKGEFLSYGAARCLQIRVKYSHQITDTASGLALPHYVNLVIMMMKSH